ncbi:MAG: sugar transporter substrate-binding protein [Frondihabitans sp.]|nr:sugar transporter substrate-binding protein [Frondihabitans sp.]
MTQAFPLVTRRGFLGSAAALGALALTGTLAGCSAGSSVSGNPDELVLWYWDRSLNPKFLKQAAAAIPGSPGHRILPDILGTVSYDTKFRTTLAGHAFIPDIVALNSNVSLYFPDETLFVDLDTLGGRALKSDYYDWKWSLGVTPSGRHCFWPIDTGPTGFFYREDIFAKAGLPTEPADVFAAIRTWDDYIDLGKQLRTRTGAAIMINGTAIFNQYVNASAERYFDRDDKPLYEKPGNSIRAAWDTAVKAIDARVTGNLQSSTDQNAGWVSGKAAAHIEGAWWTQVLKDTAPSTSGKWRITQQPARPGNSGGSFLAVPTTCKDPQAAFDFISWMTGANNQAQSYNDIQLFPSTPASFTSGIMRNPGTFFGPQNPLDYFSGAAKNVPVSYISTYEAQVTAFATEITNVEATAKNPDAAWRDAVDQTNRILEKRGVKA